MTTETGERLPDKQTAIATSAEVAHLIGARLPDIAVQATTSDALSLADLSGDSARLIVYAHPAIGAPDRDLITPDWMSIPGAFGCTAESCSFRDLNSVIRELGATVCGLSTQIPAEQCEAARRLSLTFPLLSDDQHVIVDELGLPTWSAGGHHLLKRFTLVARGGVIEECFAPVAEPSQHAEVVAAWLRAHQDP